MPNQIDRQEGRRLFGLNPQGYEDSRPDYPRWIFERLRERGALLPGTSTLEIGPGTGRATRPLLRYGANPFDLVATATALHWVEPACGLQKVRSILKNGGFAALFWNVLQDSEKEDAFHEATASILAKLAVSPSGAPGAVPFALDRETRWTLVLNTEQIGNLYEGFSHIQRLNAGSRTDLLSRLMAIADIVQISGVCRDAC